MIVILFCRLYFFKVFEKFFSLFILTLRILMVVSGTSGMFSSRSTNHF